MPELIKVYRVENVDGRGPYQSNSADTPELIDMSKWHVDENHPEIYFDIPDFEKIPNAYDFKWLCGFLTLNSLREWFDGYIPALNRAGFQIKEYMVPKTKVYVGSKQVLFFP